MHDFLVTFYCPDEEDAVFFCFHKLAKKKFFKTISHFRSLGWRLGLQAVTGSTICLFFLGLFYRSASLYHPQRRAILHLKDMSKRKGKDKNKIESKPPYFDFAILKIRSFQVILLGIAIASTGIYSPLFFLVSSILYI